MKLLLRTVTAALAALLYSSAALAQTAPTVPNGAMETWVTRNSGEVPQSWLNVDDVIAYLADVPSLPVSSLTMTKSSDAHGGSFAAQLETKVFAAIQQSVPGQMFLGTRLNPNGSGDFFGGIPYTSRPTRLQFWYKATIAPNAADKPAFAIQLLKTNGGTTQEVAYIDGLLPEASTYTLVDVPITYYQTFAPDTMQMFFTSSHLQNVTVGNKLSVDDITLAGVVTASRNPATESALQIYPNPSKGGEFSLASLGNAAISTAPFIVSDVTGREVLRQAAASPADSHGRLVDLRGQRPGLYTLRLQTPEGHIVRKLVVE
ncbi:T9SS type A sorting domain-containing protein [Hymenobacter taeanensis]|uniref:T9SS type A sorting domain-containing protein n=1 Tax=Hymenobacter taeanensis TaxID=2735321 RepID=A0A6M6BBS1_9BACT|nr:MULTISPECIES: T9SS type A sorting domain-containing protein [Hymenobacter]QJX45656.1 T9SS type A sorting domain-containing protein [Hymenobacter taeanensis]UOQ79492.1 T9SS type A sorting domain-containing protein [Hymenobacter sp. 5414T-23]